MSSMRCIQLNNLHRWNRLPWWLSEMFLCDPCGIQIYNPHTVIGSTFCDFLWYLFREAISNAALILSPHKYLHTSIYTAPGTRFAHVDFELATGAAVVPKRVHRWMECNPCWDLVADHVLATAVRIAESSDTCNNWSLVEFLPLSQSFVCCTVQQFCATDQMCDKQLWTTHPAIGVHVLEDFRLVKQSNR